MGNLLHTWETEFDDYHHTIIHTLNKKIKIVCNMQFETITVYKEGQVINAFTYSDNYTLSDYYKFLSKTVKDSQQII